MEKTSYLSKYEAVRHVRSVPPPQYVLKIESFSLLQDLLQKSGVDNYESNEFEAGGYKWRLRLYPEGNKKEHDATGHISLYLTMSDAKNLSFGCEVNVLFKFFILDQVKENYLIIEEGRLVAFHSLKTTRGIPRLISLLNLRNPSNGYLIDDCCIIGVEVLIVNSEVKTKGESLILLNEPDNATINWKVANFSKLKDEYYYSELLEVGGFKWKMRLFPCGNNDTKDKGTNLSLFLYIHDKSVLGPGKKVFVQLTIIMKDQVNGINMERKVNRWFCSSYQAWGFINFVSLVDLKDEKKGYLVNDTLLLEAKITFISVVDCSA